MACHHNLIYLTASFKQDSLLLLLGSSTGVEAARQHRIVKTIMVEGKSTLLNLINVNLT